MKALPLTGRTLALLGFILPLLALFVYVGLRSGPLAPVAVTVTTVESKAVAPSLFGIGTVEARTVYSISPTATGRVQWLGVEVGDRVTAGQLLGEMDPVDLDDRLLSLDAAYQRVQAALREAETRQRYAKSQAQRYEQLLKAGSYSEEALAAKRNDQQIAEAGLASARQELARADADRRALAAQRANLRLVAPADGLVVTRDAEPGTTRMAGQTVVEIIDPSSLWINVRFDQSRSAGIAALLPARIVLRSRPAEIFQGQVLRIEPKADAVTEELLAKLVFTTIPEPLPPLGELAEATVDLPPLPSGPVIPNAAVKRIGSQVGVWTLSNGDLRFAPVDLGQSDLTGFVQVNEGLEIGDQVVVYSEGSLTTRSRVNRVDSLPGASTP